MRRSGGPPFRAEHIGSLVRPAALLRALLPRPERDELVADIALEYRERLFDEGAAPARRWLWRQALGSAPALLHWSWWREWTGFEPDKVDVAAQKVTGKARGNLTLRGKSREVTMPVTVTVDASKRVGIEGELTILLTDFGIEPPSQLGMISVEDKLKLWISLRARTLGPVEVAK